jgi:YggT family protein
VSLVLNLTQMALSVYVFLIFGRFVLSWVPLRSGTFAYRVYSILYDVTEPYLRIFRRFLPLVRMGNAALDLSPIAGVAVLFLVVRILARL